jgi:oligoribonuclease
MTWEPTDTLVWLDIETTTLDPGKGAILELGMILTDGRLKEDKRFSTVVGFGRTHSGEVDEWPLIQHMKSGLLPECWSCNLNTLGAERKAVEWLRREAAPGLAGTVPMCGASIHFDRAWLKLHMPELESWFYYGNLDVSSIEKLARLWHPNVPKWEDRGLHRAIPDCEDAIAELNYYAMRGVVNGPSEFYP